MTRQTDNLQTLLALAAQFPATLARIMERDSEHVELLVNLYCARAATETTNVYRPFHGWEGEQS